MSFASKEIWKLWDTAESLGLEQFQDKIYRLILAAAHDKEITEEAFKYFEKKQMTIKVDDSIKNQIQYIYVYIDTVNDVVEVFSSHKATMDFGNKYYEGDDYWQDTGYVNIYKRKIKWEKGNENTNSRNSKRPSEGNEKLS